MDIGYSSSVPSGAGRLTSGAGARLASRLGWVLILFVILTPIPLGSARPVAWTLNAAVLGAIASWYFLSAWRLGSDLRLAPMGWMSAILFLLLCGALALQLVPGLGRWAPILTPDGTDIGNAALSLDPGLTWLSILRFVSYATLALLLAQVASRRHRALRLLEILFWAIVAYAVYGLIALRTLGDTLLFFDKWAYAGMVTGTFVNHNSFATFLAFGLVIGTGLAFFSRDGSQPDGRQSLRRLSLLLLGLLLIGIALIATQSRMGIAVAFVGGFLTAFLSLLRLRVPFILRAAALLCLAAAAVALPIVVGADVAERVLYAEGDLATRVNLYQQVWNMIVHRPWLGYGAGAFESAYGMFQRLPVSPDVAWEKAHNTYLTLWSELGFVAGSIPLLIVLISIWGLVARLRGELWVLPSVALGAAAISAVHSLADFSLEIETNAFVFTAILVLGAAGEPLQMRRAPQSDRQDRR
jgi:O-antigen ligase